MQRQPTLHLSNPHPSPNQGWLLFGLVQDFRFEIFVKFPFVCGCAYLDTTVCTWKLENNRLESTLLPPWKGKVLGDGSQVGWLGTEFLTPLHGNLQAMKPQVAWVPQVWRHPALWPRTF